MVPFSAAWRAMYMTFLLHPGILIDFGILNYYRLTPVVVQYKFGKFTDVSNLHYWVMLFWDKIVVITMFHDPLCQCSGCQAQSVA